MRAHRYSSLLVVVSFFFLCGGAPDSAAQSTALGARVASMQPGTWVELDTIGFNNGAFLETATFSKSILQWSDKAVWNPVTRQFYFVGAPHYEPQKFVIYSEASNAWTAGVAPCQGVECQHAWGHNALNPATGEFFHRRAGTNQIQRYRNGAWSSLPNIPAAGAQISGALEYFPDRNGLVWIDGAFGVWFYNTSTNQWTKLANTTGETGGGLQDLTLGPIDNFAVYNPIHKAVLFGGGDDACCRGFRDIYKLDSSGKITKLRNAPIDLGVNSSIVTIDPVSGKYLVFGKDRSFYEYDLPADTWTLRGGPAPPIFQPTSAAVFDVVATPVSTYGVVMFVKYYFDQSKVYLYKHAASALPPPPSDTTPPAVSLTSPAAGATVTSTVTISASASDNVAVSAVQFRLDGVDLGAPDAAAPYSVSWTTTSTSNGSHILTAVARDASGNEATSAPVTVMVNNAAPPSSPAPAPPPSAPSDFTTRCQAPGVIKCVGFDQPSDIAGDWQSNSGITPGNTTPELDGNTKASGNSSIKFTVPSNSGSDPSGSYFTNFSPDLSIQFGENSEFFVQWRQRFSTEFLSTHFEDGDVWKQIIIGTGDQPAKRYYSCTALEVVVNAYGASAPNQFPIMYNSCTGSTSHGAYDGFYEFFPSSDFKLQNARPSPFCLYSQGSTTPPSFLPPRGNCLGYFPNEWMTFQVRIKTGPRVADEFTNSFVELWVAREGQPSQQVINWGPYNLTAGAPAENQRFGKVWLTPYNTLKNPAHAHPTAYTWYDELIISRNRIADPGGSAPAPPPPAPSPDTTPPTVSVAPPPAGAAASGSSYLVTATAADNVGVAGVQFQLDGANVGSEDTSAPYSYTWNTTTASNGPHLLRAVARDAAGNVTTSSAVTFNVNNTVQPPVTSPPAPPPATTSPDVTRPTVSLTEPAADALVSGPSVTVSAAASDNVAVAAVQFKLDGANLGAEDTSAPYSVTWDTTRASDGVHTLTAVARDRAGNRSRVASVRVYVNNGNLRRSYRLPKRGGGSWRIRSLGGAALSSATLEGAGAAATGADEGDALTFGYLRVEADSGTASPAGAAVFGFRRNGVLISEAGVPGTAPVRSGLTPVEIGEPVNTGVAMVNPNTEESLISFVFYDTSGAVVSNGSFKLGPNRHVSAFLNEQPFSGPNSFQGAFSFDATAPVSVVAMRGFTNERGEFVMTTLPIHSAPFAGQNGGPLTFPHFADGGGWTTQVTLVNAGGAPMTGVVEFLGQGSSTTNGSKLEMTVNGQTASSFSYAIPPFGATRLRTSGAPATVQVGSVRIAPGQGGVPLGSVIFSYKEQGVTVSEAGIPLAPAGTAFQSYVRNSLSERIRTGLAISNPSTSPVTVNLDVTSMDGASAGLSGSVQIPGMGHVAKFLDELFPSLPAGFEGVLRLASPSPVAAIGLRGRYNERGEFLITTIPFADDAARFLAPAGIIFPHIVSGGGYSTELLLINSGADGSASGNMLFVGPNGSPLTAELSQ